MYVRYTSFWTSCRLPGVLRRSGAGVEGDYDDEEVKMAMRVLHQSPRSLVARPQRRLGGVAGECGDVDDPDVDHAHGVDALDGDLGCDAASRA